MYVIDLGDITTDRGREVVLPIWVRLHSAPPDNPIFQFKIVRDAGGH